MELDSGSNIPLPKSMQVSDWVKLLTVDFTPDDLNKETAYSLLHYLEDLQLLIPFEDTLQWKELRDGMALKEQIQVMRDGMLRIAHTEICFAMPFFIGFE